MTKSKKAAKAEVVPSVSQLKATVLKEHKAAQVAARTTIAHAIRAGEALLQIRDALLLKNEWTDWIENEFPLNRSQGYLYMRLAQNKHLIPPHVKSLKAADKLMVGLPTIDGGPPRKRANDLAKQEAFRWREENVPYKQIAKRLGMSVGSVYRWFNPNYDKIRQRENRNASADRQARLEGRRLAVKNDTALSVAYALAERMRDVLGQARREAQTREAKASLERAEEYHHVTRDSVFEALKEEA